jgi:hypothetical protein
MRLQQPPANMSVRERQRKKKRTLKSGHQRPLGLGPGLANDYPYYGPHLGDWGKEKKREKDVSMIYTGIVRARLLCRHVQSAGQFNFYLWHLPEMLGHCSGTARARVTDSGWPLFSVVFSPIALYPYDANTLIIRR